MIRAFLRPSTPPSTSSTSAWLHSSTCSLHPKSPSSSYSSSLSAEAGRAPSVSTRRRRRPIAVKPLVGVLLNSKKSVVPSPLFKPVPFTTTTDSSLASSSRKNNSANHRRTCLVVEDQLHGIRYDEFLQRMLAIPRSTARLKILNGQVAVDGFTPRENVMPALTLSAAQTVTIMGQSQSDLDLREKRIISRLDKQLEIIKRGILYRDERILIVNKPASVAHAAGSKTDIHMERLVDELRFGNQEPPRLVNVLEKGVSGILVLARSKSVWEYLTRIFSKPEVVERKYHAVLAQPLLLANKSLTEESSQAGSSTSSSSPSQTTSSFSNPLDFETITTGITLVGTPPHEKMSIIEYHPSFELIKHEDENPIRKAVTHYAIKKVSSMGSHVILKPETSRTHQLRVHCAQSLGASILGDYKYGSGIPPHMKDEFRISKNRQPLALHLGRIEIKNWFDKDSHLVVQAPLPDYFQKMLNRFDLK